MIETIEWNKGKYLYDVNERGSICLNNSYDEAKICSEIRIW